MIDATKLAPKLYIGSFNADDAKLQAAGFSRVIRLAGERFPHDFPLTDEKGAFTPAQRAIVRDAVAVASSALRSGQRVLIQCNMGVNRSALVAALTICEVWGMRGYDALRLVRNLRNQPLLQRGWLHGALTNDDFTRLLCSINAR